MIYTLKMCRHRLETRFADDEAEIILVSIREAAVREVVAAIVSRDGTDDPDEWALRKEIADEIAARFLSAPAEHMASSGGCKSPEHSQGQIAKDRADAVATPTATPPKDNYTIGVDVGKEDGDHHAVAVVNTRTGEAVVKTFPPADEVCEWGEDRTMQIPHYTTSCGHVASADEKRFGRCSFCGEPVRIKPPAGEEK